MLNDDWYRSLKHCYTINTYFTIHNIRLFIIFDLRYANLLSATQYTKYTVCLQSHATEVSFNTLLRLESELGHFSLDLTGRISNIVLLRKNNDWVIYYLGNGNRRKLLLENIYSILKYGKSWMGSIKIFEMHQILKANKFMDKSLGCVALGNANVMFIAYKFALNYQKHNGRRQEKTICEYLHFDKIVKRVQHL